MRKLDIEDCNGTLGICCVSVTDFIFKDGIRSLELEFERFNMITVMLFSVTRPSYNPI